MNDTLNLRHWSPAAAKARQDARERVKARLMTLGSVLATSCIGGVIGWTIGVSL